MSFGEKYIDFMRFDGSDVEFLEGTTAAGKTTTALIKFILACSASEMNQHIIAAADTGSAEKNLINKEYGIMEVFGDNIRYFGGGTSKEKIPHLYLNDKHTIYIMGYDDRNRWKKALGGQYGCLFIDEINTAHVDFVREAMLRSRYTIGTLNPDSPDLPIYDEFINMSRPLQKWADSVPDSILEDLHRADEKKGWRYWFFDFYDNVSLSSERIRQIQNSAPVGSKIYKNKVLGLRGRAEGLVFDATEDNFISREQAKAYTYKRFTCGVDTSYSKKTNDTFSFSFNGITSEGLKVTLRTREYNNAKLQKPLAPSDIPPLLTEFMEECRAEYGFAKHVFIDNADAATIRECEKYKKNTGGIYDFVPSYKRMKVIDRIALSGGWLATGTWLIVKSDCEGLVREMNCYSWQEKKDLPEDANDHTINADQYAYLPFVNEIRGGKIESDR